MKSLTITSLIFILCINSVISDDLQFLSTINITDSLPENMVVIQLDENMNRIIFDLFVEVFGNNPENKVEVPVSLVGELYRNYTQEQLDSLYLELSGSDSSFDGIREKVDLLQQRFTVAKHEYDFNHDLNQFENKFIQIGEHLLALQKLVLKLKKDNSSTNNSSDHTNRKGRQSKFLNIFDRLAGLLLGVNIGSVYPQNPEPISSNKINQVIKLMKALQTIQDIPSNTKLKSKSDIKKLQNMLFRLQQIQELNRLANKKRPYLQSESFNPYRYEAVLNLVKLIGTANGANPLQSLLRVFSFPNNNNNNKVKNTNISQEKLKILMKAIEEQELKRQRELEAKQQKELLNNLLKNQNKQQEQLDKLIKILESQNNKTSNGNSDNSNNVKVDTPSNSSSGSSSPNQKDIVNKLKEQREQLNSLLQKLGQTNQPTAGSAPQTSDMRGYQEMFSNLLKNMGPMMAALSQTGLISQKQSQSTQNSLSDLLKITNIQNDDSTKSIFEIKVENFLEELKYILDSIK